MTKKLKVTSKQDGFRRAGIAFSAKEPTILDPKDLKKEQIAQLEAEPMLVVTEFEDTGKTAAPEKDNNNSKKSKPSDESKGKSGSNNKTDKKQKAPDQESAEKADTKVDEKKPSGQSQKAEDRIKQIESSEDKAFVEKALKDNRVTVKAAAEKRLKELSAE